MADSVKSAMPAGSVFYLCRPSPGQPEYFQDERGATIFFVELPRRSRLGSSGRVMVSFLVGLISLLVVFLPLLLLLPPPRGWPSDLAFWGCFVGAVAVMVATHRLLRAPAAEVVLRDATRAAVVLRIRLSGGRFEGSVVVDDSGSFLARMSRSFDRVEEVWSCLDGEGQEVFQARSLSGRGLSHRSPMKYVDEGLPFELLSLEQRWGRFSQMPSEPGLAHPVLCWRLQLAREAAALDRRVAVALAVVLLHRGFGR